MMSPDQGRFDPRGCHLVYIDACSTIDVGEIEILWTTARRNAALILDRWRDRAWPICHLTVGEADHRAANRIAPQLLRPRPGDLVVEHRSSSSLFANRRLVDYFSDLGVRRLLLAGGSVDGVILKSVMECRRFGLTAAVVADAVSGAPPAGTGAGINVSLNVIGAFAAVVLTRDAIGARAAARLHP